MAMAHCVHRVNHAHTLGDVKHHTQYPHNNKKWGVYAQRVKKETFVCGNIQFLGTCFAFVVSVAKA